jgi:hypothetical protein
MTMKSVSQDLPWNFDREVCNYQHMPCIYRIINFVTEFTNAYKMPEPLSQCRSQKTTYVHVRFQVLIPDDGGRTHL